MEFEELRIVYKKHLKGDECPNSIRDAKGIICVFNKPKYNEGQYDRYKKELKHCHRIANVILKALEHAAYKEENHIEKSTDENVGAKLAFGHCGTYKYRVLDKNTIWAIHHTNDYKDAKQYFEKCKAEWIKQDCG